MNMLFPLKLECQCGHAGTGGFKECLRSKESLRCFVVVVFFWFCFHECELIPVSMACYCWNGLLHREPTLCFSYVLPSTEL